jgi:hypothetical protein
MTKYIINMDMIRDFGDVAGLSQYRLNFFDLEDLLSIALNWLE